MTRRRNSINNLSAAKPPPRRHRHRTSLFSPLPSFQFCLLLLLLQSLSALAQQPPVVADATCSTGIPTSSVCCAESCGTCGGSGCSARPGGSTACCGSPILDSGLSCLDNPPPCVLDLEVNPGDPINPFCATSSYLYGTSSGSGPNAGGIRDDTTGACCLESCGSCGGDDTTLDSDGNTCENRNGGATGCCVSTIIANAPTSGNSCEFHKPPCYSQIDNGITFEHWKSNDNSHPWHPLNQVIKSAAKCESANNECVETTFQPNEKGTERVTGLTPLPQGLEYTLTYDVKFDENFEFVKGGKLHGLGPANHVSGCSPMTDTGWSARVMWREEGQIIIYVYHQDKTHNCGHNFRSNVYFTRGQWETISLYVKVNSSYDQFDGKVQLYLNGILITEATDLRFVDDPSWAAPYHSEGYIANFMFSAFHGGSNTDWSPTTTQYAWIDNISVVPGHSVPTPAAAAAAARMRSGAIATTDDDKPKAATVLPAPKSYDAHEMSCEDEDALPFDDDDTTDNDNPSTPVPSKTSNLRNGFSPAGVVSGGPAGGGFMRDTSNNRISVRLHSELKLIFESSSSQGAGAATTLGGHDVLNDAAAITVLQEITGSYFNQLFSTTNDSAFAGTNARFSMENLQVDTTSQFPIKFTSHVEMDDNNSNNNSGGGSGGTSSKDIQRLMTNGRLLNHYLAQLKQTSSSNAYYRHVEKVVVRVIRHGGGGGGGQ